MPDIHMPLQRYGGFYHDGECWLALIGGAEWTRSDLEKALPVETGEQLAEITKALAELPTDSVAPTKAQRRKIVPTEGDLDD